MLFLVDTGSKVSVIMPYDQQRIEIVFNSSIANTSIGWANIEIQSMTQSLQLSFSGFRINQQDLRKKPLIATRVVSDFYLPDPQRMNWVSLLGMDILSLFDLTIDRDRVILETDENPDERLEANIIHGKYFRSPKLTPAVYPPQTSKLN